MSREMKLALISASAVVLAAVVGALLTRGGGGDSGPSNTASFQEDLQVSDVAVTNQAPPSAQPLEPYDAATSAGVVVTLRNPGTGISVITRARIEIEQFQELGTDGCVSGAGPIPVSANYQAALPATAQPGQVVEARLSQQVQANSADRVGLGFALADPDQAYTTSAGVGASRLYQLKVQFFHDDAQEPLDAGTIILALPFPWEGLLPDGQPLSPPLVTGACWQDNAAKLQQMLALPGTKSPELQALAAS